MADRLDRLVGEAEGETVAEQAPETVSLAMVQKWCARNERLLRMQYPDGKLPARWEAELGPEPTTMTAALERWALLRHCIRQHGQGRVREADAVDAREAARQILRREPVRVELDSGRTVEVRGRSYGAIVEIAAHALAVQELSARIEAEEGAISSDRYRALGYEVQLHRRAIWAHALRADPSPARSLDEAPAWWREITPADDARLLAATYEAMFERRERLGAAPEAKDAREPPAEHFGWMSILAMLEAKYRVAPATFVDGADLMQITTRERLAGPPTLDELAA